MAACARVDTGPVPVEDRSREATVVDLESQQGTPSDHARTAATGQQQIHTAMPAAIDALVRDADTMLAAGQEESAAATLERAIRIDARNAVVWYKLARVKLVQGQLQQALTMARRSNSLSGQDYYLQLQNWRLILAIKERLNDHSGIQEASARIDALVKIVGDGDS